MKRGKERGCLQVIYADTLFLLNAIVDYLLILAAARVAGEPLARFRFALGACIGGAYAVLIFVLPFLEGVFYKITIGLMIISISYGRSGRLIRQGLIFIALSFAFAGGILAIGLFGGQGLSLSGGVLYSPMDLKIILLSAAFCYVLLSVVFQNFGKHSSLSGELVSVVLRLNDKEIPFTALVDTGNTLRDPASGVAVMVVEGALLAPLFQKKISREALFQPAIFLEQCKEHTGRLRLLPYQAVGVQGLLLVMRMDGIWVNGIQKKENLVALSPTAVSDGGSYQGLVGV